MRKFVAICLLLLAVSAVVAHRWTVSAKGSGDLERLLSASESAIVSDKRVIIKHTGSYLHYSDEADFLQKASRISTAFHLPVPSDIKHEQDLYLYKPVLTHYGNIQTSIVWIGFPDGTTDLRLNAEALSAKGLSELLELQKQWTQSLQVLGVQAQWNIIIQGALSESLKDPLSLQTWLSSNLQTREIARYQDAGSLSISYYSPVIRSTEPSGEEKMNLQLAVHQDSITHRRRITLATPAISIEY